MTFVFKCLVLKQKIMENSNPFHILFWLKLTSTRNRKTPLYKRITLNGKRTKLSLK